MALRLFPQLSRSLRAAPVGSRAVSRTPEQLGIFDWMTRRAQPQDVPNVSPHSSATSSGQQAKAESAEEASAASILPEPELTTESDVRSAEASSSPSGSAEPAIDAPPVASSSGTSSIPPQSSASSTFKSSSTVQPSPSSETPGPPTKPPVAIDTSLFASSAGVKITSASPLPPAPTSSASPASSSSSASVQSYSPPPAPPSPPPPSAAERWAAINETRKAQLFAQNARAGNKYTGRTMHFRPGDISRAIGQVQTIVRTNDIRTELIRNEYFEAKPLKRWRKKRQYWADYITVGVRV